MNACINIIHLYAIATLIKETTVKLFGGRVY